MWQPVAAMKYEPMTYLDCCKQCDAELTGGGLVCSACEPFGRYVPDGRGLGRVRWEQIDGACEICLLVVWSKTLIANERRCGRGVCDYCVDDVERGNHECAAEDVRGEW